MFFHSVTRISRPVLKWKSSYLPVYPKAHVLHVSDYFSEIKCSSVDSALAKMILV